MLPALKQLQEASSDDDEWNKCMSEAGGFRSGNQLRQLFATLLVHCAVIEPYELYMQHREAMAEDFLHKARQATRIAALLLDGSTTAHSRFKIPLKLSSDSTCILNLGSDVAQVIQTAAVCVWDEAPMMHKHTFDAVDRSFRDDMKQVDPWRQFVPFGGKVMVFGGDFRQVTPVVHRGSRTQISAASTRHARFWPHAHQMRLTTNMRVAGLSGLAAQIQTSFSNWLLRIGSGDEQTYPELGRDDMIRLPDEMCMLTQDIQDLVHHVYGDRDRLTDKQYIMERSILTPKNETAHMINNQVMQLFPGEQVGLFLPEHVFSQGQLYVALSRVGSPDRIRVMVADGTHEACDGVYTRNVVYKEILQD
ncbi:hypothetical protein WJX77_007763 [Trebouxia sp. C0004]